MTTKLNIEFVREEFEKEGYKLLSEEYKGCHEKLKVKCPKGHITKINWDSFKQGGRCVECRRMTIEKVRKRFEKEGFTLLSTKYVDSRTPLKFICPNGHKHKITLSNWGLGTRCAICTFDKLRNMMIKRWGDVEYREKRSRETKELWKDETFQHNAMKATAVKPNGKERKLTKILNNLFPGEYKYVGNFKFWIDGKNPDFMNVNGQKKLIELFGDYWHSESVTGEPPNKNEQKRIRHFKKHGFNTLIIWESELREAEKVKEKLIKFHNS